MLKRIENEGNQMEQGFLIAEIIDILDRLDRRDHVFAAKMIEQYDHTGNLSPKQVAVLEQILARVAP
jgi:hypothetical protein